LALVEQLLTTPEDGRIKLYVTSRALNFRQAHRELFAGGDYLALLARGARAEHVLAFSRKQGEQEVVVLAARFFVGLGATRAPRFGLDPAMWDDTALPLGPQFGAARYRDRLTGREFTARDRAGGPELMLSEVLAPLPVALLERM
jgi:(1->4)-alpha-D-glucan 1-alpha-D-glucosylmutase